MVKNHPRILVRQIRIRVWLIYILIVIILVPVGGWLIWLFQPPEAVADYVKTKVQEETGLEIKITGIRKTLFGVTAQNVRLQVPNTDLVGYLEEVNVIVIHPALLLGSVVADLRIGKIPSRVKWPLFTNIVRIEFEDVPLHQLDTSKEFELLVGENFLHGNAFYDLEQKYGQMQVEIEGLELFLGKLKFGDFKLPDMNLDFPLIRLTVKFEKQNFDLQLLTEGSFGSITQGTATLNPNQLDLSELNVTIKGQINQHIYEQRNFLISLLKLYSPDGQIHGRWLVNNKTSTWQDLKR